MKHLKSMLFAHLLEVLNSLAAKLDKFKSKALSKKVCPPISPPFSISVAAAIDGTASALAEV
jgi:hypothetical protein